MPAHYYIIAGEHSGDSHSAALMQALQKQDPALQFSGLGGEKMSSLPNANIENWLEDAAVLGIWEVLKKYRYFKKKFAHTLQQISETKPDAILLTDYPGFNLRLAKALHKNPATRSIPIIYYISPQVWAWNQGRIPKMARWLDLMLCIFPFEKPLYEKSGLPTQFIGHPLISALAPLRENPPKREEKLLGLFPGSREREVSALFPEMLHASKILRDRYPELKITASAANPALAEKMHLLLKQSPLSKQHLTIETDNARSLMQRATLGVVASGTATLEAAFLGLPYCLVYKVAPLTYFLGRLLVRVPFLGIINILAGKELVKELLQTQSNGKAIAAELHRLFQEPDTRTTLQKNLLQTTQSLGTGNAAQNAAQEITTFLKN